MVRHHVVFFSAGSRHVDRKEKTSCLLPNMLSQKCRRSVQQGFPAAMFCQRTASAADAIFDPRTAELSPEQIK